MEATDFSKGDRLLVKARAILRFHNGHFSILCPIGHLIEARKADRDFAGSAFEAEIGAYQAGLSNRFDRLAAKCNGAGHENGI